MHRVIAPGVRVEQTRRRMAKLRNEGLVDRITLPQAGRLRVWFPTSYGTQIASEWPELRGRRPPRTVSDPTAARLRVGHTLTVTETALAFLEDARRRGDLCRPLDWIPEVHHSLGGGEAVIPDALMYYRRGPADGDDGAMLRAFVEVDRATTGPERLAAKIGAYARLYRYISTPVPAVAPPSRRTRWRRNGGGAIRSSPGSCSSWTAPARSASPHASAPCVQLQGTRRRSASGLPACLFPASRVPQGRPFPVVRPSTQILVAGRAMKRDGETGVRNIPPLSPDAGDFWCAHHQYPGASPTPSGENAQTPHSRCHRDRRRPVRRHRIRRPGGDTSASKIDLRQLARALTWLPAAHLPEGTSAVFQVPVLGDERRVVSTACTRGVTADAR
ncbi:replication-relaxation family protein [Streptomyces phaeochromogenes]|nr:replication-relaxation family protein [Streptomyces phaeochromogenes]